MAIKIILIFKVLIVSVLSFKYSTRITEKYAEKHQFPHHVLLVISLSPARTSLECGGALISPKYVLTAAHCLYGQAYKAVLGFKVEEPNVYKKYKTATVFLGAHEIDNIGGDDSKQIITASEKNFKVHEDFDPSSSSKFIHDIGLIDLPVQAIINEFVKPVNLPSKSIGNLVDKKFYGAGWGKTTGRLFLSLENHNLLRYIELKVSEGSPCEKIYSTNDKYNICADRYNETIPCVQDSGAPEVIQEADGSYTLIGVVSYHLLTGCMYGYPVIAARVSAYLDWISNNTGIALKN